MAANPKELARVHLMIDGWVQEVFFRVSAVEEAVKLGVKGWVRNCADGSVEVVAEGTKQKVEELVRWCRHGPPRAEVHHVRVESEPYKGEFNSFRMGR